MKRIVALLVLIFLFSAISPLSANTYYVATDGFDTNPGTFGSPWRTIAKAAQVMVAGDTTYIRGGIYNVTTAITPTNSGSAGGGYITFSAYQNEIPVIDGGGSLAFRSFTLTSAHSYFRWVGLTFRNLGSGSNVGGAIGIVRTISPLGAFPHHMEILNCIMDDCSSSCVKAHGVHDIIFAGCSFTNSKQGVELAVVDREKDYNIQIIDCDFYNMSWEGVVAKAAHNQTTYDPTEWCQDVYITGCESSYCSDDGFDLFGIYFTIEHCVAHHMMTGIDRHGFKIYALDLPLDPGKYSADFYRCLVYANNREGYKLTSLMTEESTDYLKKFRMRNCTAAGDSYGISLVTNSIHPMDVEIKNSIISSTTRAWEITGTPVIWAPPPPQSEPRMPMLPSYLTLNTNYNLWYANANLPINYLAADYSLAGWQSTSGQDFNSISLNPQFNSSYAPTNVACIDTGTDVGLPYAGNAPDMGYFESGMVDISCPADYLTTGENWISVPAAAFNDGPYSVFKDLGTWPNTVYHKLYRYNPAAGNTVEYPTYQSDAVQFGKIIPGQAYKLILNANQPTLTVKGIELKKPQSLTIDGTGTRDFYFGNPFNKTIYKTYCKIDYNGTEVSLDQAITNGWVGNLQHFNPASKILESMGFSIEKWHAYKLTAYNSTGTLKIVFNYIFPGDLDSDGDVDWNDLDILSQNWLVTDLQISPTGDLDNDKDVDFKDFAILANNWMAGL